LTVVVASSNNDNSFAVIDFSDPTNPVNKLVTPPFTGGCVVDCAGTLAAAGNTNGGQIAIYDISNPGSPLQKATVATGFGGIGAISFDGTNVLAGEQNGSQVILVDVTNPAAPTIVSTYSTTINSIASIALNGALAVASGPNNLYFVILDYANPASPTEVPFSPGTGGVYFDGVIVCDLDGTYAAAADGGGGGVYLFDVAGGTLTLLSKYQSDQSGITSISVSGTTVAAASTNDATITLVSFSLSDPGSPSGADTNAGLGGGVCVKLAGGYLAAGAVNSFGAGLFSVSGTSAAALGTDDTTLGSIGTLGITSDVEPEIAVSPASLAFGTVNVNTTSAAQTLTLSNNGTAPLDVTGLATSSTPFAASPSGTLPSIAPRGSQTVRVTFTPSAAQSYSATLTMTTNDPSHPTVSVPLSGTGAGQSAVGWTPAALAFGTVVAGETGTAILTISNSGSVSLQVTGIAASPSAFTAVPTKISVSPKGSQPVTVSFSPAAAESYTGTLAFQTSAAAHPSVSVPLSGTGLSPAQPGLEVFAIFSGQVGRIWQLSAGGGWSPWDDNTWQVGAPQIAGGSAVCMNADGRLEVFGRSLDGNLGHTYQLTPQGLWSPWTDVQPLMPLAGDPRVFANADRRLEVFAMGPDGNLGHTWQNVPNATTNWSGWHSLGVPITTNPAVARNADGRLEVLANGPAYVGPPAIGHIWQTTPGGGWSAWTGFNNDYPVTWWPISGNPAVAQNADGRLEVFAIGPGGNLGHTWQNVPSTTTNWSGWSDLGPAITSNPAVARNADGRLEVFAIAPVSSGPPALGHIWQTIPGGGWSPWTNFGTIPNEYSIRSDPSVAQNADGRLEVFAIGPGGNLGHMWQNVASTTTDWWGWEDLGPAISGNPAAAANE
jgi:hypothetical protein